MRPIGIRVLVWPGEGREGTLRTMAGRKRHSAEDIVRKLRRADELAAAGQTGEQIAADLGVSAATLYNWRRQYGGVDT
ncbi:transposase, partial [Nocardia noduli]|uniref:transposase n=1 Tax=Nocardia noduli TaxID=2815722 RepID=UPI0027E032E5